MIGPMLPGVKYQTLTDAGLIQSLFSRDQDKTRQVRLIACRVQEAISGINRYIEESTSAVCPSCRTVCCRNKHGYHTHEDLIYLYALGLQPPQNDSAGQDADPCYFLTAKGCSLPRTMRPSGCNWYFCDSLYDHMEKRPGYEAFDRALEDLAGLWMEMVGEYRKITGKD